MSNEIKKLYRSRTDRIIAGVCGGLAEYFNVDSTFVRLIFLVLIFADGIGVLLYLALMIFVPEQPSFEGQPVVKTVSQEKEPTPQDSTSQTGKINFKTIIGFTIIFWGLMALLGNFHIINNFDLRSSIFAFFVMASGLYLVINYARK